MQEQEGYEFVIVSLDNKQWHFEAASNEEREEWVQAIEKQILTSLQSNETNKLKAKNGGFAADSVAILTMKSVPGNNVCADCDSQSKLEQFRITFFKVFVSLLTNDFRSSMG